MDTRFEEQLIKDHFECFEHLVENQVEGYLLPIGLYGIECGNGWYELIDSALGTLEKTPIEIQVSQIKEKDGQLRLYWRSQTDKTRQKYIAFGVTRGIEFFSQRICELCGRYGSRQKVNESPTEYKTRCPDCLT